MMVLHEKVKGFLCVTTHPEGCRRNVHDQIQALAKRSPWTSPDQKPLIQNALILGGSTGYGLATRIALAFGLNADTLNVSLERPPRPGRSASPGWYQSAAMETAATERGLFARTLNGDAFADATRERVIEILKERKKPLDLLIYSLASPKRTDPATDTPYSSALKPIGASLESKTVNVIKRNLHDVSIEPANEDEITATVKVMGGEDWALWVEALRENGLLAHGFQTLAYSYVGSELTADIYRRGTIGRAKEHLESTARSLHQTLSKDPAIAGSATISVNKALVTQASSAIPILPLYVALLARVMKEKNLHEGTAEQIWRLFDQLLARKKENPASSDEWFRLDDHELSDEVQTEVLTRWKTVNEDNLNALCDLDGYWNDFLRLFGFGRSDVDYDQAVEEMVELNPL